MRHDVFKKFLQWSKILKRDETKGASEDSEKVHECRSPV